MPRTINWQDEKVKRALIEIYEIYTTAKSKRGIMHRVERMFYEKTGKRVCYTTLWKRMREIVEKCGFASIL